MFHRLRPLIVVLEAVCKLHQSMTYHHHERLSVICQAILTGIGANQLCGAFLPKQELMKGGTA